MLHANAEQEGGAVAYVASPSCILFYGERRKSNAVIILCVRFRAITSRPHSHRTSTPSHRTSIHPATISSPSHRTSTQPPYLNSDSHIIQFFRTRPTGVVFAKLSHTCSIACVYLGPDVSIIYLSTPTLYILIYIVVECRR